MGKELVRFTYLVSSRRNRKREGGAQILRGCIRLRYRFQVQITFILVQGYDFELHTNTPQDATTSKYTTIKGKRMQVPILASPPQDQQPISP